MSRRLAITIILQYPIYIANRKNKIITQTFIDNDKTRFWIAQLVTDIKTSLTPLLYLQGVKKLLLLLLRYR